MPDRADLPQGTLDLLILHVVSAGPIHGYAIAHGWLESLARSSGPDAGVARAGSCLPLASGGGWTGLAGTSYSAA